MEVRGDVTSMALLSTEANVHRASYRVTAEGIPESRTNDLRFLIL